jgi:hypothetical protein
MLTHVLGVPLHDEHENDHGKESLAISQFSQMVKDSLFHSLPSSSSSPHGIYLDSCHHHTFASSLGSSFYSHISDSNHVTIPEAFTRWYQQQGQQHHTSALHIQEGSFPCSHCCGPNTQYQQAAKNSLSSSSFSFNFGLTILAAGLMITIGFIFLVRFRRQLISKY